VINGLTDLVHPCQSMTDYFTAWEKFGDLKGRKLAYVGDGNNMAHSLLLGGALAGLHVRIASPKGYQPLDEIVQRASAIAADTGGSVVIGDDPEAASTGADVLYTDVWASMGQEDDAETRKTAFAGYTLDDRLLKLASDDAIVLHCLPAHRGEEVAASVIDGPRSRVFDQAENRLHAQKALLAFVLERS
jgi:ornithine carbamoyltransferase